MEMRPLDPLPPPPPPKGMTDGSGCGTVAVGGAVGFAALIGCGMAGAYRWELGMLAFFGCFIWAVVLGFQQKFAFAAGLVMGLILPPLLFAAACFAILVVVFGSGGN